MNINDFYLGQGGFGQVFAGQKTCGKEQHMVAIKMEKQFRKRKDSDPRRMVIEQKVLILLRGKVKFEVAYIHQTPHIPLIYASGKTEQKRPYIVMLLLGPSLWDVQLEQSNKRFSLRTIIRVSQQILCGLQYLHEVGYIRKFFFLTTTEFEFQIVI
ncbi:hypothetical protein M3Y96_01014200 [Aphelenchoides besseyi]|nr:hypothetical protein M3Y96_01014200 [Aphelenchoides besseyi]